MHSKYSQPEWEISKWGERSLLLPREAGLEDLGDGMIAFWEMFTKDFASICNNDAWDTLRTQVRPADGTINVFLQDSRNSNGHNYGSAGICARCLVTERRDSAEELEDGLITEEEHVERTRKRAREVARQLLESAKAVSVPKRLRTKSGRPVRLRILFYDDVVLAEESWE
jgi:hypothetical protein